MSDILILASQLPYPAQQGGSLRILQIMRGLAGQHQLTLLCFQAENQSADLSAIGPLLDLCEDVVTVPAPERDRRTRFRQLLTSRLPDMAHRMVSPAFNIKLRQLLHRQQFDIVHVESIELAGAINTIRAASPDSKILFDNFNAEAELQRRALLTDAGQLRRLPVAGYSFIQMRRLRAFETWAIENADWTVAVSEADAELLRAQTGRPIHVVPNSIDVSDYELPAHKPTWDYDLVITGKMDYRPNIDAVLWFGQKIWPLIRQHIPSLTWAVVGQKPHERLDVLRPLPGVTVTGRVAAIQPYLAGAKVYILPFRMGSGTRLKLIEAMAAGLPIVSTQMGAEGFPVAHDEHLLLADTPQAFADAVIRLLRSPADRRRLGTAAWSFAAGYDWRVIVPQFEQIYASVDD